MRSTKEMKTVSKLLSLTVLIILVATDLAETEFGSMINRCRDQCTVQCAGLKQVDINVINIGSENHKIQRREVLPERSDRVIYSPEDKFIVLPERPDAVLRDQPAGTSQSNAKSLPRRPNLVSGGDQSNQINNDQPNSVQPLMHDEPLPKRRNLIGDNRMSDAPTENQVRKVRFLHKRSTDVDTESQSISSPQVPPNVLYQYMTSCISDCTSDCVYDSLFHQ